MVHENWFPGQGHQNQPTASTNRQLLHDLGRLLWSITVYECLSLYKERQNQLPTSTIKLPTPNFVTTLNCYQVSWDKQLLLQMSFKTDPPGSKFSFDSCRNQIESSDKLDCKIQIPIKLIQFYLLSALEERI